MRAAHPRTEGFAQLASFICDRCQQPLGSRFHCFDCRADLCETCAKDFRTGSAPERHRAEHTVGFYRQIPPVEGERLAEQVRGFREDIERNHVYPGVSTYLANAVRSTLGPLLEMAPRGIPVPLDEQATRALETFRAHMTRRSQGRFVDYFERSPLLGREVPDQVFAMSQGVADCMRWRGVPLFKTVFDISLYPRLLWDLKPRTIFESGTASGGGALWLADQLTGLGLDCHLYTYDLVKPPLSHPRVSFLQGDSHEIEQVFTPEMLKSAPHPWIILEDAHVNVNGLLSYLHPYLQPGDYVIVEDPESGPVTETEPHVEDGLGRFLWNHRADYKVDTFYADFFGYNTSCAMDAILRRM